MAVHKVEHIHRGQHGSTDGGTLACLQSMVTWWPMRDMDMREAQSIALLPPPTISTFWHLDNVPLLNSVEWSWLP